MKFTNIVKYSLATVALTLWSSCDFKDLNDDPSKPKDVPVNTLLPSIEGEIAYSHGGEFSRYTSMFTQHAQGFNRQWVVLNAYGLSPDDVDNVWRFSVYSALMDLKQLTTKADADGYNNYSGIGRVLTAYYLMLSTDHFGDMPYSEAFQGTDNLQPKFDSQEDIYKVIDRLLSEAIQYLGQAAGPVSAGGSVDLIYGGDIAKWKAFASAVQARMYLHLGKRDGSNYQKALSSINASGWTSGGKDARYPFGASGAAPWYQFNEQRGDIEIGAKMVELMTTLNDPRDAVFNHIFDTDHPWFVSNQDWALMSTAEAYFIKAECLQRTSGSAQDIHDAYVGGITAAFGELGLDPATYLAQASVDPGVGNVTLDHIMTQKYLALFCNPESFSDWRRTGIPALTPNTGNTIPRRYPYPQTEEVFNSNTPVVNIFTDKVWWDN